MGISNGVIQQYRVNLLVVAVLFLFAAFFHLFVPFLRPALPLLLLIVAALVAAPVLASVMGEWLAAQFYPSSVEAGPPYSLAEARRQQGAYEEAYHTYADIARNFPGEFEAHAAMLELATENLNDPHLAERTLAVGLKDLPDHSDRQRLHRLFGALMSERSRNKTAEAPLHMDPLDLN